MSHPRIKHNHTLLGIQELKTNIHFFWLCLRSKRELKLRRAEDEKVTRLRIEQSERDFQRSQIEAIKVTYRPMHPDVYEAAWRDWMQPDLLDALDKASCGE